MESQRRGSTTACPHVRPAVRAALAVRAGHLDLGHEKRHERRGVEPVAAYAEGAGRFPVVAVGEEEKTVFFRMAEVAPGMSGMR